MSTAVLTAALEAAEAGLSVIPVKADGTKVPSIEWKANQKVRADEAQIRKWFAHEGCTLGLGVVTGKVSDGLELLEFEGRAVEAGIHREFRQLAEKAGLGGVLTRIMAGYTATSPSGGFHLLYHCLGPVETNQKLAKNEDKTILIETRGEAGYLLTPPSNGKVHETGRPYVQTAGSFATITTITAEERTALLDLARTFDRSPRQEWRPSTPRGSSGDRPGDDFTQRGTWPEILEPHGWEYVYTTSDKNQHWRRGGKTIGTSATISEDGQGVLYVFTTSTIFESERAYSKFSAYSILEHGGDWSSAAAALRAKGYGESGADETRHSSALRPSPPSKRQRTAPTPYSAADLQHMKFTEPRAIIPSLIHVGATIFAGKAKLGKSWAALDLALAVASGGLALGSLEVVTGEVLYLALEDNRRRIKNRIAALLGAADFPPRLYIEHDWPKLDEGGIEAIEEWLDAHPDASMVVIDVWKRLRQSRQRGAQLYDEDSEHLYPLQALAMKFGVAILVIHHTRKAGAEDVFDEISGSGGILAAVDAGIILHRTRSQADGEIWITGRDYEDSHLALRFEGVQWTLIGPTAEVAMSKASGEIIDALKTGNAGNGGMTPAETALYLGKDRNQVKTLMYKMLTRGEIRRLSNSKYTVALPVTPVTRVTRVTREAEEVDGERVTGNAALQDALIEEPPPPEHRDPTAGDRVKVRVP